MTRRLDGLLDDYTDETLTKIEYVRARDRVRLELESVESALGELYSSQRAGNLRFKFDAESIEIQWAV